MRTEQKIHGIAISSRYERLILFGSGISAAVIAWSWMARFTQEQGFYVMVASPHAVSVDIWSLISLVCMWQVMMVAMMMPVLLRWMVFLDAVIERKHFTGSALRFSTTFASGYFFVWLWFSCIAATMQILMQAFNLSSGMYEGSRMLPGAVLIVSGLFQLTSLKWNCLKHCRSPLAYLLSHWKNGPMGGYRLGVGHGWYCLGCCWALMITAFVLGTMNLTWMAFLTVVTCVEQIATRGRFFARAVGIGILGLGLVVLIGW